MRFIFISLLATNFVLAFWIFFSAKNVESAVESAPVVPQVSGLTATDQTSQLESKPEPEQDANDLIAAVESLPADEALMQGSLEVDPTAAETAADELCTVIGPFNNLAQADILVEQLAGLGVGAELRKVEVPIKKSFWLYLEPMATKEESKEKLADLLAQGVDSYIIPKGDLVNGISIGVFVEQYRADIRKKELADLGYEVSIRVDVRTAQQSWVVAAAKETVVVSSATWANLLEGGDEVTYKQNYCSDVASLQ